MLCCTVCVARRPLPANKGGVGLIAVCQGPCSRVCAKASCGRIHAAGCVQKLAVAGSMQQGVFAKAVLYCLCCTTTIAS